MNLKLIILLAVVNLAFPFRYKEQRKNDSNLKQIAITESQNLKWVCIPRF